jgi:hypothetical protein
LYNTTGSTSVTSLGCAASSKCSGIGRESTHWRTGTCGITWCIRWAAVCASSVFGLGEEGRCVLLHQSVQRGLFRAVALAVDRGAIRRPLGLPADGLHARLPNW